MCDDEPNRVLLSHVGAFMRGVSGPVIIGGDMQMTPEQLHDIGFAARAIMCVLAPRRGLVTIRRPDGKAVRLDMFAMTMGHTAAAEEVCVLSERRATPHWPVMLNLAATAKLVPVLVPAKAGSTVRVVGPAPPPTRYQPSGSTFGRVA